MIRVRLVENYTNWYWNSMSGVTIRKDNREGVMANEDDPQIKSALDQGILELVTDSALKEIKEKVKEEKTVEKKEVIITDAPAEDTIKEVVSKENTKKMEKLKKKAKGDKDGE